MASEPSAGVLAWIGSAFRDALKGSLSKLISALAIGVAVAGVTALGWAPQLSTLRARACAPEWAAPTCQALGFNPRADTITRIAGNWCAMPQRAVYTYSVHEDVIRVEGPDGWVSEGVIRAVDGGRVTTFVSAPDEDRGLWELQPEPHRLLVYFPANDFEQVLERCP